MEMSSIERWHLSQNEEATIANAITEIPVKIGKLCKQFNLNVLISHMPSGIAGQIRKVDENYEISVSRYDPKVRQRFTIAHELAHFLLHKDIIDQTENGITDTILYRSNAPLKIEFEANRLAADILMPSSQLIKIIRDAFNNKVTDEVIETLARKFEVSTAAMEVRLSSFPRENAVHTE